jgi:thiamine biosynthesis lipoprotein
VVHGGCEAHLDHAERRLRELESWWSRFLLDSDITRANHAAGRPVVVHDDTLAVVRRAIDGWQQTTGRFDITTLPALLAAGYTHSTVDRVPAPAVRTSRGRVCGLVQLDYGESSLTVPAGAAIDLGGIGKGFAADVVAEELVADGAGGALVNLGGDIAVQGLPADSPVWSLGIDDPFRPAQRGEPHHVARFHLVSGGVATSGTTIRRWTRADGSVAHHLIDPITAAPTTTGVLTATVIAADAATAEVFATAAATLPGAEAVAMLDGVGLAGLVVTDDGCIHRTASLKDYET